MKKKQTYHFLKKAKTKAKQNQTTIFKKQIKAKENKKQTGYTFICGCFFPFFWHFVSFFWLFFRVFFFLRWPDDRDLRTCKKTRGKSEKNENKGNKNKTSGRKWNKSETRPNKKRKQMVCFFKQIRLGLFFLFFLIEVWIRFCFFSSFYFQSFYISYL